jgi:hypothetical protein
MFVGDKIMLKILNTCPAFLACVGYFFGFIIIKSILPSIVIDMNPY